MRTCADSSAPKVGSFHTFIIDAVARSSMPMQEYLVRSQGALWQVWLDDVLVAAGPAQMHAVHLALDLARAAARHGHRSRILITAHDGLPIELPIIEPQEPPLAGSA
jgi:hypothetical protein